MPGSDRARLAWLGPAVAALALVSCVAAVITTRLHGPDFPEWFGSFGVPPAPDHDA
ncbi:MAG TPA: hypothetical protein VIS31_04875 [Woeseiaceae bacterium]